MPDVHDHGLLKPTRRPVIPGRPQTVADALAPTLARDPDRDALVGRHGRYSFAELDREANRAAHALRELGVEPGDRVAACLPNDTDLVVAFLACMRLGAIWVGVNRPLAPREKAHILRDAGASVWLATPEAHAEIASAGESLPDLDERVVVDPGGDADAWRERVRAQSDARPDIALDPWGPAAIAYTSGTTGLPKGAVHSQHNILLPGAVTAATGVHPEGVPQGAVLPMTILNLVVLGPVQAWQNGSCLVAMDRIDAVGVAEWVEREGVGSFAAVPTVLHDLLTHPDVRPEQLASLTQPLVGGAECPEEFRALYRERFGSDVAIGYGMTEAPTSVTRAEGEPDPRPGLCGKALPQIEITIRDDDGRSTRPGVEGEICVGPATTGAWAGIYTPMLGYWNRPDATAGALRDGIYHSGDIGVLEADGTLYIHGRRNELILRGGANVYPAEVERALLEHPSVGEAAVLGLPDRRLGERVVAAVVRVPGVTHGSDASDGESLRRFCRERLARYKVPDAIAFVDVLPRNAMSKVVKRALHEHFDPKSE